MADVFLSYSKADVERVQGIISFLKNNNYSVWWDVGIVPGTSWSASIESELNEAKSVVVVWSHNSVKSEWVQIEAAKAKEKGKYVPIIIDKVLKNIPLEFSRIEVADFSEFDQNDEFAETDILLSALKKNSRTNSSHVDEVLKDNPYEKQYKKQKFWQRWQTKITVAAAIIGIPLTLFNTIAAFKPAGAQAVKDNFADSTQIEFMYLTLENDDGEMPDTIVMDPRIRVFLNYPKLANELISLRDSVLHLPYDSLPPKTTFLLIQNIGQTSVSDIQVQVKKFIISDSVMVRESVGSGDYEKLINDKVGKSSKNVFTLPSSLAPGSGILIPLFEILKPKIGISDWAITSQNVCLPEILDYKNGSGKRIKIKIRKMVSPVLYKGGVEGRG